MLQIISFKKNKKGQIMPSSLFPTVTHPHLRESKYTLNPIANLAKAITDVVLLPFKMITFIFFSAHSSAFNRLLSKLITSTPNCKFQQLN